MNKRYLSLASDTMLFGVSSLTSKLVIFVLLPIYTSVLSSQEYGIADMITNLVNLFYPLLTLAVAEAVLRYSLSSDYNRNELISTSFIYICFVIILLFVVGENTISTDNVIGKYWGFFVALFGGYSIQNLFSSFCKSIGKNVIFAVQGISQTFFSVFLTSLLMLVFKMKEIGFLWGCMGGYILAIIFMFFGGELYKNLFPLSFNFGCLINLLKYSVPLVPSMLGWWLNNSADKYVIIMMMGIGASGIYAVAHKIPSILTVIADIFNQAFLLSSVNNVNEADYLDFTKKIWNMYFVVNCAGGIVVISLSELIGKVLFTKYYNAWVFIPFLVVSAIFSNFSAFLTCMYKAIKITNVLFVSTIIGAVINIILNFFFVYSLGLIGAGLATMISFAVVYIIRYQVLKRHIKVDFLWSKDVCIIVLIILFSFSMSYILFIRYLLAIVSFLLFVFLYNIELRNIIKTIPQLIKVVINRNRI